MFNILFFLQYTSVVLILLECAYITKKWSSPLHGWLFFYCVAVLINNAGYLAYMQAGTEDALVLCWQMVYLGKAWVPFALFMFVLVLCKGRTYPRICTALSLLHAMTYFMILKMRRTGLYYRSFTLSEDGLFPHLEFENGIWHYGFDGLILLYIVIGVTMVVRTMISQTERHRRKQMTFIVLAVMADCTCHILKLFKLARGYDLNMLGFSIASVFLFIAIFVYDFMNAKTLAREFIMENISEGIVVTDEKDGFIIGNSKGEALLHTIDPIPNRAIQTLRTLHAAGRPLVDQGRTFSVREEVLKDRNHVMGRVYMIEDDTEHFRYIEELKEQKLIADKANQAKGEFLSNMSHEIRSPINAVLGLD